MSYYGVENFLIFLIGTIGIVILPGPNSLFVMNIALQNKNLPLKNFWQKFKMPLFASLGIMCGDTILMILANLGVASILKAHPKIFSLLSILSSIYILYLGLNMLKKYFSANKKNINNENKIIEKKLINYKSAFLKALIISLLNPKAIIFFTTFFVQFVNPKYSPLWHPLSILMIALQIISFSYLFTLVFITNKITVTKPENNHKKNYGLLIVGILFSAFGAYFLLQ